METIILLIILIAINVGFLFLLLQEMISSIAVYVLILLDAFIVILFLFYLDPLSFIVAYEPFDFKFLDVFLECAELGAFIALFCAAFVARAKYPVIGGKGWNVLLWAVILGSIGMFLDLSGEFITFRFPLPFHTYKLLTNLFQIIGIIGLALAFLIFYKFSEILFSRSPEDKK